MVNWALIYPSLFLNPFPSRPAKTVSFIILLGLMPDDFTRQGRAFGWKRGLKITANYLLSIYRFFYID